MDFSPGRLPAHRKALSDLIFASRSQRRRGRAEAYRAAQLHGAGALVWINSTLRSPLLTKDSRRVLCLAYWYLSMVITPPERWDQLE